MTASDWNMRYPVGTWVRYYPDPNNRRVFRDDKTRGQARHLSTGTAVVGLVKGGTVPLAKLEIVPVPQPV